VSDYRGPRSQYYFDSAFVSEMVDELSPEVIFGLIAELIHESESSLFAEVHELNQDNDGNSNPRG
jgi:hypothetical protein